MNKRKNNKSDVWNYFEKATTSNYATCSLCKKEYNSSGNTSNLRKHLLNSHRGDIGSELFKTEEEVMDEGGEPTRKRRTIKSYFKSKSECYSNNSSKKKEIDIKVALMIARDMQPFSFVEDEGFVDLMHLLDPKYNVPTSRTVKTILNTDIYDDVYKNLMDILATVSWVSLTTDLWTSSNNSESYCTITCHFVYEYKTQSAVLQTVELPGSHTAENIKNHIEEVLTRFEIKKKVTCIVSDNAANMKLCCSLLHIPHLPCFAHSLNLVVEDAISGGESFKKILEKVRALVTYFKRSNVASDILKEQQRKNGCVEKKLLKDVATRWNSILTMIRRFLEIGDNLVTAIARCPKAPQSLCAEEFLVLEESVLVLSIFENATIQMSGDNYITVSLIIPITMGIYMQLTELENSLSNDIVKHLLHSLKEGVVKRLYPYESRNTPQIASLLDPRVKQIGFRSKENATKAQEILQQEVVRILLSHKNGNNEAGTSCTST